MSLLRRRLAWAVCSFLAACAAEEGPPAPLPQSRLSSTAPMGPAPSTPAQNATPAAPEPSLRRFPRRQELPTTPAPATAPAETAVQEAAEEPPRDLAAELLQQLGGTPACLVPRSRDEAPPSLRVALTAVVSPTGRVTRSEATSGQLRTEELRCIRDQVEHVRFATPVEDAPTSVHATLELQLGPANATP